MPKPTTRKMTITFHDLDDKPIFGVVYAEGVSTDEEQAALIDQCIAELQKNRWIYYPHVPKPEAGTVGAV